jgi:predicted RNA-binding protein with PIN domain
MSEMASYSVLGAARWAWRAASIAFREFGIAVLLAMPARFLLIDGYNLLHAAGMARQDYGPGDLQRCRERLLRFLAQKLSAAEIARTTVIFDARDPPPDRPAQQTLHRIQVLFANPLGDADVVIQEWLADHSAPKRVTLVSSDHVLQRAARRHRAEFIDSEAFFEKLQQRRDRPDSAGSRPADTDDAKPGGGLSAAETAHWLKFFGDLSSVTEKEGGEGGTPEVEVREVGATEDRSSDDQSVESGPDKDKPRPRRTKRSKRKPSPSRPGPGRRPMPEDAAYWLEVFKGLPEAQELARGKSISQADLERWLSEFDEEKD